MQEVLRGERGAGHVCGDVPDVWAVAVPHGLGQVDGAIAVDRAVAGHGRAAGARPAPPAPIVVVPRGLDVDAAGEAVGRPAAEVQRGWSSCSRDPLVVLWPVLCFDRQPPACRRVADSRDVY